MALHLEQFVHLAGLTHDDALIAWGGFWFDAPDGGGDGPWRIVENPDFGGVDRIDRRHSIGVGSAPYGHAVVEVRELSSDRLVGRAETAEANHVWIRGLQPGTDHRYRVTVEGEGWGEGVLRELQVDEDGSFRLAPSGRRYDNRFRTYPAPDRHEPLTFAVLGDYGIGMLAPGGGGERQARLARSLENAIARLDVRLVLTTGDNVYLGGDGTPAGSGEEDDDWYFSFYEPYRHVINRVPVYPTVGNHDASDTEQADDREQVSRNLFTDLRFAPEAEVGRSSLDPGLFYWFEYGADVRFVCIDTTLASELEGHQQYFQAPQHRAFLDDALPDLDGDDGGGEHRARWRVPFSHHPAFCAGPSHDNLPAMVDELVPRFERAGVRLVLAGHEHNFQWQERNGVAYVVSGAGGKLRQEPPVRFEAAHTVAWAAEGHLLLVRLDRDGGVVEPVTEVAADGTVTPLRPRRPDGGLAPTRIALTAPAPGSEARHR